MSFQTEDSVSFGEPAMLSPEPEEDQSLPLAPHSELWQPLYNAIGREAAHQFDWKAETGSIQTYEHRETLRFLHIDGETGEFLNQQCLVISKQAALAHALQRPVPPEWKGQDATHASEPASELASFDTPHDLDGASTSDAALEDDGRDPTPLYPESTADFHDYRQEDDLHADLAERNDSAEPPEHPEGALNAFTRTRAIQHAPALPQAGTTAADRRKVGIWSQGISRILSLVKRRGPSTSERTPDENAEERRLGRTVSSNDTDEPNLNVFVRRSTHPDR